MNRQKDIDAQNREMDALAERWELRIHAIALTITAVVLGMRLIAGRQDLTSDGSCWTEPTSEASVAAPPADTSPKPERAPYVDVPESLSAR